MNFNSNVIISEENYKYYFANTNSTYEEPNGLIRQIQIVIRAANEREARKHYAECILRNNLRSANDINFREMSDPEAIREYEELALSESELKELYDCQSISKTTISDKEYTLETLCCFSKNQLINRVKGLRTSSSLRGYSKEEVLQAIEHYDDPQYCKMREYLEKYL